MSRSNVLQRVCASCGSELLPAMVRCRECGSRQRDPSAECATADGSATVDESDSNTADAHACPSCGEALQRGMARCRNCNWTRGDSRPPSHSRPPAHALGGLDDMLAMAEDAGPSLTDTHAGLESPTEPAVSSSRDELIPLQCECGRRLRAPAARAGKSVRCPACERTVPVPAASSVGPREVSPRNADRYARLAERVERLLKQESARAKRRRTLSRGKLKRLAAIAGQASPARNQTQAEHLDARRQAIAELAASRDPRAVEILVAQLADESPKLRARAAEGLGESTDAAALPALVRLLGDSQFEIRKLAIESLGKVGHRLAVSPLLIAGQDDPHMKYLASSAIVSLGEEAVQPLVEALQVDDGGTVLEAIVLLGRLRSAKAIPALVEALHSRSAVHRAHVAEALGRIGDESVARPLAELLRDEHAAVRASAAHGLSFVPHPGAARALIAALGDADEDVRRNAALALAELGDQRAADSLCRLLADGSEGVRLAAAEALGRTGDLRAVDPLLAMLGSESETVQLKAIGSLKKLKDERAVAALLPFLKHSKVVFRQRAADSLGGIGDALAAAQLEQVLLSDAATEARVAAARALGEIRDPGSIPRLEEALHDEFPVRCRAVLALGQMRDEAALPAVLRVLHDPVPEVRLQATAAAAELGHRAAVPSLEALLDDAHEMVRRGAARALVQLGDERGEALVERAARGALSAARKDRRKLLASILPSTLLGSFQFPEWLDSPRRKGIAGGSAAALLLLAAGLAAYFTLGLGGSEVLRRGDVAGVSFSPDGSMIAVGRTADVLQVWDVAGRKLLKEEKLRAASVAFGADSSTVALVGGIEFTIWNTNEPISAARLVPGHQQGIVGFAVTNDRTKAVTRDSGGTVIRWDLATATHEAAVQIPTQGIAAFALGPDGGRVAAATQAGTVLVWDMAHGEKVAELSANVQRDPLTALAFLPDGKRLAAGFQSGNILVWDLATRALSARLPPPVNVPISAIDFPADGQTLIATRGTRIDVWDLQTSRVRTHDTIAQDITTLSVSGDGKSLAIGNKEESEVYIYDLASGELAATLDVNAPR
ncbi:MAG: HEAT repeat domain-containing protein [Planctomycetales bacterium]